MKAIEQILVHFDAYTQAFDHITFAAKQQFLSRNWAGLQALMKQRLDLYSEITGAAAIELKQNFGDGLQQEHYWKTIKPVFCQAINNNDRREVAQTFYNTVCRKATGFRVTSREVFFIDDFHMPQAKGGDQVQSVKIIFEGNIEAFITKLMGAVQFEMHLQDLARDLGFLTNLWNTDPNLAPLKKLKVEFECIANLFYRNKLAYLVGRFKTAEAYKPFIIPFVNSHKGIIADTIITDYDDAANIFSITRSYFFVQTTRTDEIVHFLDSILPSKAIYELYNAIGFNKHGKSLFYRDFVHFAQNTNEQIQFASGTKGMVMTVFTLPSFDYVFKLIKDRFLPPKDMTKLEVKEKYKLVSRHDRVGRMADTHEFENFVFPKHMFGDECLAELKKDAGSILLIDDKQVIVKHLYTERQVVPLNIYLNTAHISDKVKAIEDYGNCIKDLAGANIFPGDMFMKNFGLTRLKRLIFYDYDELMLLTDCNFKAVPAADNYAKIYAAQPWFNVGKNDVFPEQFKMFLPNDPEFRTVFELAHADLFTVDFWMQYQQKIKAGEIVDFYPYQRSRSQSL